MDEPPEWLERDALTDQLAELHDRRETATDSREECLDAIEAGDLERAEGTKREYQLRAFKTRQQEGEILWASLGHAIADLVDRGIDPDDAATTERGSAFLEWAVETETLASVRSTERVAVILARRFPTVPDPHEPYAMAMFDLSESEIEELRSRDRRMLEAAGWLRRGRSGATDPTLVSCPHCEESFPVNVTEGATPESSVSFTGSDDEMREICPHCERDVFVTVRT